MIQNKIIKHLNSKLDRLRQQLRDQDSIIKEQEELINELTSVVALPKFREGLVVSVVGMEGKYIVQHHLYDINYPMYNVVPINKAGNVETVLEVDMFVDNKL